LEKPPDVGEVVAYLSGTYKGTKTILLISLGRVLGIHPPEGWKKARAPSPGEMEASWLVGRW